MASERKGKKLRRCTSASKNYYKVQFDITERNGKKRIGKQVRHFPEDMQARACCERRNGPDSVDGNLANCTRKARRRIGARAQVVGI